MVLKDNVYLKDVKPLLQQLLEQLLKQYQYVSILAVDSRSKQYSVSKRGISVNDDMLHCRRGFVVKIHHAKRFYEYSFHAVTEEDIPSILDKIEKGLIGSDQNVPEGIFHAEYDAPADIPLKMHKSSEYQVHPDELGDQKILERLGAIREKGLAINERILDCSVNCNFQIYGKLFLSKNRDLTQNILWMTGACVMLAKKEEEIKDSFHSYSILGGAEVLDQMEDGLQKTADAVLSLLDSSPMVPGEYDCICAPDVTGLIVHEAFGHGVEMDMFVKKRALAEEYIGEYVASPLITMHDGPDVAQPAVYYFDDEGTISEDTLIIEKGILKRGISDMQSAGKLGTVPTGNGRRESYERKAYTRMTNTYFEEGKDKLSDMIASISYGFLLSGAFSGMEDPKNWGIQCMVKKAEEIKDGRLTGRVFSPVVMTGYVPDLLKSISMVSDQAEYFGSGYCGKGYKEWVKVSDGGPYMKAKIRLG